MGKTFEQGRDEAVRLCQFFAQHRDNFRGPGTKEAYVRQQLIDPLFEALGWDLRNTAQVAPQYREVVTEDSLDVEGQQRAPDYAFRVGTTPKFYVEAKKCGVNLAADPAPAFQLRRYGWSGKVPVSILTDFEEFAVYDCTTRPRPGDKASLSRTLYFTSDQYPDRWRELWDLFSRDAVWSGAFDQYATSKRKRGTSEVDTEFLHEIESWRERLARNLALRNPALSSDDLNAAVQRTIDRVIFLRMAEDRGLEPYERLLTLSKKPDIYHHFIHSLCLEADGKYNSGIFHFSDEKEAAEPPDKITPGLVLDDKVFKPILESLYFAHGSPYHFGVLPVEILGTVYERFLGKVIRLTAGHQAKVEEKPEVRKAGGVYYTPAYIVDYIVRSTVGVRIAGKSPAQLAGGKGKPPLRVLDMACGSGSFLLGAYQCLLDHCLRWYQENTPEKHPKAVHLAPHSGAWRLTIEEKKRILTTHLFGVDIDLQAVEVSKLSLLLKALEGEDNTSLSTQGMLVHQRVLPNLAANIQCGNSLIGPDYFTADLLPEPQEMRRVNPFDWTAAFPQAMKDGGFDCIIGNPPYGRLFSETDSKYLATRWGTFAVLGDAYVAFMRQAYELLLPSGYFGYIIPSAWLGGPAYTTLRSWILETCIRSIVVLPFDVFKDAYIDTAILVTSKEKAPLNHQPVAYEYPKREKLTNIDDAKISSHRAVQATWARSEDRKLVISQGIAELIASLTERCASRLKDVVRMRRGVLFDRDILTQEKTSADSWPYFEGDVYRYDCRFSAPQWVEFGSKMREYPRSFEWFEGKRLLLRRLVNRQQRLMAALTDTTVITNKNLYVLKVIGDESPEFILGVLNSRLISRLYVSQVSQANKDDFPQVTIADMLRLPFPKLDLSRSLQRALHDRMVTLVTSMLTLQKQLASAVSEAQRTVVERQIAATDAEINRLVYGLYGLTQEEIGIVEG